MSMTIGAVALQNWTANKNKAKAPEPAGALHVTDHKKNRFINILNTLP